MASVGQCDAREGDQDADRKRVVRMPVRLAFAGVVSGGILTIGFAVYDITHRFI